MDDLEPENRWLRFGLSTNPYFPEPLNADENGPRPITLFRGRRDEVKDFVDTIAGEASSLTVIEGASGTGKSTFVNYGKHILRGRPGKPRWFAPSVEVGVQSTTNAQSLLVQVIDAVVRHASDMAPKADWRDHPSIHRARMTVEAVENLGGGFSLGFSLPGGPGASVGGSRSGSTSPPQLGPVLSPAFFEALVTELRTLTDPPMAGVVLHVNNLETLMQSSMAAAHTLFNDLRDHFHIEGLHWAFLGPPGLHEDVLAPEKRVRDFVKGSWKLDALPLPDVLQALEARYERYAIRSDWTAPTEESLVSVLYDFFGGDLRGTLNSLTLAHRRYNPIDVVPMPAEQAVLVLQREFRARFEQALRGKTRQVLDHLLGLGQEEFTQDDAISAERHQSNRSIRFSELAKADAIRLIRTEGTRKIYTFGGPARMAYGAP